MSALRKYLARYAEPDSGIASRAPRGYFAALVVPALAESSALLDGYRLAARAAPGRVLVVLVVNAPLGVPPELRDINAALIGALQAGTAGVCRPLGPGVFITEEGDFDVLVVDRSSPGRELPAKQGVGLARKIGLDIALRLFAAGAVRSPWLGTTDADVTLPEDYFDKLTGTAPGATALLHRYAHDAALDDVGLATLRYESFLRYNVLGLSWARSPYAYPSLGSAISVDVNAYAGVRGVPKREAGEDFHLLAKLAKLGPLERSRGEPIRIRARRSARVPFGTGPRVALILRDGELAVTPPEAYRVLQRVLFELDEFAVHRDERRFAAAIGRAHGVSELDPPLFHVLEALGLPAACRESSVNVGAGDLRLRLHTWFDALRTVRLLHALRHAGLSDVPLSEALQRAPFAAPELGSGAIAEVTDLRALEEGLPLRVGPTLLAKGAVRSGD